METVDILCLANSFKRGGRCVAGVRTDTGEWLRPVSDAPDGTLPYDWGEIDGVRIRPLDVIRVPLACPAPRPHQPENWRITTARWTLLRTEDRRDAHALLEPIVTDRRGILGTEDDRLLLDEIHMRRRHASLALIKVSRPEFRIDHDDGRTQTRCRFTHHGVDYDLSVTEDRRLLGHYGLPSGDGPFRSKREWYFTISLTEPWNDACYKIVAGVIPVAPATSSRAG